MAQPSRPPCREQFIELWDTDLVTLPPALPAWFIAQQQMLDEDAAEWARGADAERKATYFRVSGAIASSGVVTSCVAQKDDQD
jgi:hypothetical protein